jgi:hypothetical protein
VEGLYVVNIEYQSVFPFVGIGSPTAHPLPRKQVCLHYSLRPGGGGAIFAWRVREWGDPIRTIGRKVRHSVNSVIVLVL